MKLLPSPGAFAQSVTNCWSLLRRLGIADHRIRRPFSTPELIEAARKSISYRIVYDLYRESASYDIMLADGSLLLFRCAPMEKTMLCYQYLATPYDCIGYDEFVRDVFRDSLQSERTASESYEEYLGQAELRTNVVPLRYDWSPTLYREGAHPPGHLHIGFRTDLRIAVDFVLEPHLFLHLVLRQHYVQVWENEFLSHGSSPSRVAQLRDRPVPKEYVQTKDLWELRLR
jgi:hypothetical protein